MTDVKDQLAIIDVLVKRKSQYREVLEAYRQLLGGINSF